MFRRLFSGVLFGRFIIALIIVFAFYNASGMSYYHWVTGSEFSSFMVVVGVAFLAAFIFFLYASLRAPARIVYLAILLVVGVVIWWLDDLGFLNLADPTFGTVVAQAVVAYALALGSVWSIVWRGKTGQQSVDDPDTPAEQ